MANSRLLSLGLILTALLAALSAFLPARNAPLSPSAQAEYARLHHALSLVEAEQLLARQLAAAVEQGRLHRMDQRLAAQALERLVTEAGAALDAPAPEGNLREAWLAGAEAHEALASLVRAGDRGAARSNDFTAAQVDAAAQPGEILAGLEKAVAAQGGDLTAMRQARVQMLADLSARLSLSAGLSLSPEGARPPALQIALSGQ